MNDKLFHLILFVLEEDLLNPVLLDMLIDVNKETYTFDLIFNKFAAHSSQKLLLFFNRWNFIFFYVSRFDFFNNIRIAGTLAFFIIILLVYLLKLPLERHIHEMRRLSHQITIEI